jgi:hypothetical protein
LSYRAVDVFLRGKVQMSGSLFSNSESISVGSPLLPQSEPLKPSVLGAIIACDYPPLPTQDWAAPQDWEPGTSHPLVATALTYAQDHLQQFFAGTDWSNQLQTVLGNNYDAQKADLVANQLTAGEFSGLPGLQLVAGGILGDARAAFDALAGVIYLDADWVSAQITPHALLGRYF